MKQASMVNVWTLITRAKLTNPQLFLDDYLAQLNAGQ